MTTATLNASRTSIIQVKYTTPVRKDKHGQANIGVLAQDQKTLQEFWFNYYAQPARPLKKYQYYKFDNANSSVISRVAKSK